jgi:hypothetical protein
MRLVTTENGAGAYDTTSDKTLDLFFHVNAMRGQSEEAMHQLFDQAFSENPLDAMRILFWSRDVRQGQGERRAFRVLLNWLAVNHPNELRKNLHLVPEYGRWDDLFSVFGTELENAALAVIRQGLVTDKNGLCAKWMPREKSAKRELAVKIRQYLGMSPKQYRKTLASLTKVVETHMCAQEWDQINYEHVPSQAMKNYRKAFRLHDENGFDQFLTAVEKGEKKINAGAMYPHDIMREVFKYVSYYGSSATKDQIRSLQAQWDALPNYMEGNTKRVLPVVDVSGSMSGLPMEVAVSLGMYIAERNTGPFEDCYITFSSQPTLQYIKADNLVDRVKLMRTSNVGYSTDLYKTFRLILDRAVKHNIPEEDMPTSIIIFSDMQFNQACTGTVGGTLFNKIRKEYEKAGYTMPQLTFWNLRAVLSNVPVKMDENGVALVSGFSPSLLKQLLAEGEFSPISIMRQTLDSDRYKAITV